MIYLRQNITDYNNDFRAMILAFYPGEKILEDFSLAKKPELVKEIEFAVIAEFSQGELVLSLYERNEKNQINDKELHIERDFHLTYSKRTACCHEDKINARNPIKRSIYELMSHKAGRKLPWGCLTGIRPAKIAMKALEEGRTDEDIRNIYIKEYEAEKNKAELCIQVAKKEKQLIEQVDEEKGYCLYIGIPFCPSRCLYCSFTSYPIAMYSDKVDRYIDALERELSLTAELYKQKSLLSIYIGGGTPSSISPVQMDRLCSIIEKTFDLSSIKEFTIEAGRPDSITVEKLQVMKQHQVSRISINPQTMNQETLELIGRRHTPEDTERIFAAAREMGFRNINMDLIVGLPGETSRHVYHTVERIKALDPDSLTVHSLAIKRAANLNMELNKYRDKVHTGDIDSQLDIVTGAARDMGLLPYYLYRQKNISGNLENIGFSREGLECLYNILIMEERVDIAGIGAGSSCKYVKRPVKLPDGRVLYGPDGRIDRTENVKNVDEYIERIDEMLERKKQAFQAD